MLTDRSYLLFNKIPKGHRDQCQDRALDIG